MADKRKPEQIILLRKQGSRKTDKIELFKATLFGYIPSTRERNTRYRLRINGKWHKGDYVTKWQFRDLLFRSKHFDSL